MTKSEKIKAYKRAWYERNREMQLSKEKERREARTPVPENLQYLSPSENSRKSNHLQLDIKQP